METYIKRQTEKFSTNEGSISTEEMEYIKDLLTNKYPHIKNILEIGFNAGLSSARMLSSRPDIKVTSVDIGHHIYIKDAKSLIDEMFPFRHRLLIGDSRSVLPTLSEKYDFIFVDGGHNNHIPFEDIKNSLPLLNQDGIIFVDDYCERWGGGEDGVIAGYRKCVENGWIKTIGSPVYGTGSDHAWILATLKKCN